MNIFRFIALALTTLSCNAFAEDKGLFYVTGGASAGGANFSIGVGTNVDVFEISSIKLGTLDGNKSAKYVGMSLVQNTTPINNFNLLFRVGFGKATTTFANGSSAKRTGFSDGVIFGLGGQYYFNSHFAFRGEANRITYAVTNDDSSYRIAYPLTISALYSF
jgi:hypothetical protein